LTATAATPPSLVATPPTSTTAAGAPPSARPPTTSMPTRAPNDLDAADVATADDAMDGVTPAAPVASSKVVPSSASANPTPPRAKLQDVVTRAENKDKVAAVATAGKTDKAAAATTKTGNTAAASGTDAAVGGGRATGRPPAAAGTPASACGR